jgi:hypothetical protein
MPLETPHVRTLASIPVSTSTPHLAAASCTASCYHAQHGVWYAAIGSMMNKTSLRLRQVFPTESLPCAIRGYRRVFSQPAGMSTLIPDPTYTTYAVAHFLSMQVSRPSFQL